MPLLKFKKLFKKIAIVWLAVFICFLNSPFFLKVYAQEASGSALINTTKNISTSSATPATIPTETPTSTPVPTSLTPTPTFPVPTLSPTPNLLSPDRNTPTLTTTPSPILVLPSDTSAASATIRTKLNVHKLVRQDFQANENIQVVVENFRDNNGTVKVTDNSGQALTVSYQEEKTLEGTVLKIFPPQNFKPGKYHMIISDSSGDTFTQEFSWGVLAINTNKSIYSPGETAKIAMAVLDESGQMVCSAQVKLDITDPVGVVTELSTDNGKIKVNDVCAFHKFTLTPDFETEYQIKNSGKYNMILTAATKNGSYTVNDFFQVQDFVPFSVERVTATRIYPVDNYPVQFNILANQDFNGTITETVPDSFTIKPLGTDLPYNNIKIVAAQNRIQNLSDTYFVNLRTPFSGKHEETLGFSDELKDPELKNEYKQFGLAGHDGLDFDMADNTPVLAADSGKVVLAGDGAYGTTVVLQHSWGKSYYGHLSKIEVQLNQTVKKGDEIGLSGHSGLTTGPHLHFGIKLNNNDPKNGYFGKIDPTSFLNFPTTVSDYNVKQITWNVSLKKGDTVALGYEFKALPISPEFYLLGPLTFKSSSPVFGNISPNENPFVLGISSQSATLNQATESSVSGDIIFQEARQWQIASDAAPTLNTLLPTSYSSQTGTAWTTTTVTNIDEGIANADGLFIVAGANSTSSIFYSVTSTPSDFVDMITLNYNIRYQITPLSNDTETLYVQVLKSDKTTALTNEMTVASTTTALTLRNSGVIAFTGVSTTATKADWDAAYFRIRTTHTKSGAADNSVWSIDCFELTGTYQASPTVALNTPVNAATGQSTTPTLNFTGTDANSDTVEYNVQVDTVNTFNSSSPDALQQSFTGAPTADNYLYGSGGGAEAQAMSFTTNTSYNLSSADLYLLKNGTPTDNLILELVAGANVGGTALATSNPVSGSSVSSLGPTYINFTFSTPYTLSASTTYWLRLTRSGVRDVVNGYDWQGVTSGTSGASEALGSWTTGLQDRFYKTYQHASPLLSKFSSVPHAGFTTGHPFTSGAAVDYTVQSANTLSAGTTYYWRVAAIDPSGTNTYGAWSSTYSFTTAAGGPTTDQLLRHGMWFNSSGVKQLFTF